MDFSDDGWLVVVRARGSSEDQFERVCRVLWRAFQRGELTEAEFVQLLGRFEPDPAPLAPSASNWDLPPHQRQAPRDVT